MNDIFFTKSDEELGFSLMKKSISYDPDSISKINTMHFQEQFDRMTKQLRTKDQQIEELKSSIIAEKKARQKLELVLKKQKAKRVRELDLIASEHEKELNELENKILQLKQENDIKIRENEKVKC